MINITNTNAAASLAFGAIFAISMKGFLLMMEFLHILPDAANYLLSGIGAALIAHEAAKRIP